MPLLGSVAMLLGFDVVPEAMAEHDRWHTHEHLPERLSIPGFLRGTRWCALRGAPHYMVLYEVESLAALTSGAYLQRLNNPTPWTSALMPHYRGMTRGLCTVLGSFGLGLGHVGALVRFTGGDDVHRWLLSEALPALPLRAGLGSAHLLHGAAAAAMTCEQRLRGADGAVDSALLLTGYDVDAVRDAAATTLAPAVLAQRGAGDVTTALYRADYSLVSAELQAARTAR